VEGNLELEVDQDNMLHLALKLGGRKGKFILISDTDDRIRAVESTWRKLFIAGATEEERALRARIKALLNERVDPPFEV
jgi:hypothetical protein